ncbi:MAG: hypothetical protein KC613_27100, partial [Myxococcales bacterium]|nr:hypothetical protein [Myxococcales bacterium]
MSHAQTLHSLYPSLAERWPTERVARHLLAAADLPLDKATTRLLTKAAGSTDWRSHMAQDFDRALAPRAQVATAKALFPDVAAPARIDDPVALRAYVKRLMAALGVSGLSFAGDRPARAHREGPHASKKAFNKRFRLVIRLAEKVETFARVQRMKALAQVAKTRLAARLPQADFVADADAAAFIAWQTARLARRSVFTWGQQERAFDQVAEHLFQRLGAGAPWFAVAHVHPVPEVLARLNDGEKGRLLGAWFDVMHDAAGVLQGLADTGRYDLRRYVVRRGNDSSSWNEAAGAFNAARDGWLNAAHALGLFALLDALLPPKALRLMAADVVFMHRHAGSGDLDPDTQVAQALPSPWAVIRGEAACGRADVEAACAAAGVVGRGWVHPRPKGVAPSTPTLELVHGVAV